MVKKIFLSVIAAGAVGAAAYFVGGYILKLKQDDARDNTPTDTVKLVDIAENVVATGFVEPIISTEIRSEINGKISTISVENGDIVKAGDLLMELDKTSLQSEETKADNEYNLQKLTLEQEERDFVRQEELMKKGFAIVKDYEDARTRLEKAKIQLNVKKSEWEKAKDDLSKTSILSPQAGTVTDMELTPGQVIVGAGSVNQGTLLMKVSSVENLYVKVKINEKEIEKLDTGKTPKITFDSMNDVSFDGQIIAMSPSAITENNVRVFPVKVAFKAEGGRVRPGISANIEFPVSKVENAPAVKLSAVYSDGEVTYVFLRTPDEKWEKVRVQTGISDIRHVEIKRGLKEGDVVALSFPQKNLISENIRGFDDGAADGAQK